MSLINSINQSRITRISTYTSNSPSQWGTNITPLQLSNFPQVQKIYNRVYSQPQINVSGGSTNIRPKEIVKYVNIFVDQNFVTATASSLKFVNNKLSSEEGAGETTAYGSGKLTFSISPFDNFYKFSFVKSGPSGDPVEIDLSNSGKFNISFINPKGNKIQVPSLDDKNLANPVKGELAFKIDESISTQILQVIDRRFFITNGTTINPPVEITNNKGGAGNNNLAKNIQGAIKSVFENNNNINASTNNTSSVMYWGYWKKEGEEDSGKGEIILNPVSISTSGTSGSGFIGTLESPATPSIKGIKPASGTSGTASIGSPSSSGTNQMLTGAVLIASLSAEMAGYKATGWTDISIIDYFLIPGNPGYIKYPNITVNDVITAGNNILAPGTISNLQTRI